MGDTLRIALLVYRGNPHSGGQGVYTHHLSRELAAMGHHVEVFSGQPYPDLAPEVPLVKVPSLDLYQNPWTKRPLRQITLRRWFGFLRMQCRVARQMPRIVTVSESSRRDITADMGVAYERMSIVPVGVDTEHFRPLPHVDRVPG